MTGLSSRRYVKRESPTPKVGTTSISSGVTVTRSDAGGKTHWVVLFAKAAVLDGVIKVYSPSFIQVKWQGRLGKGSEVLRSESAAKDFLLRKFIEPYV